MAMRTLLFDLHDTARTLVRDRVYSFTVVLTLALGIGAATAVFSIVNGVLLRPLPYPESDRLVVLNEVWHEIKDRIPVLEVNERHFEYWRTANRAFESMAQYSWLPGHLISGDSAAQVRAVRASGSLFNVLRVGVAAGRPLTPDDERPEATDVALLGHALWQQRFGGAPGALGRGIVLDGRPFTVVGVLPAGFRLPLDRRMVSDIDVLVPLRVSAGWLGDHNNRALGRLRPGLTIEQARLDLDALQQQVSGVVRAESGEAVTLSAAATPLIDSITSTSRRGLLLLFGVVGAVLLMTCSNLANLALSRAAARARDGAIRTALGASRTRLARRVVLEHLLLSSTGAVLAVGVAAAAVAVFLRTSPVDLPRLDEVTLDIRVLLFVAALGLLSGLLVAILPTRRSSAEDVHRVLRAGNSTIAGEREGIRVRQLLVAVQVATSVALLVVTGLLGTSLARVLRVERGFDGEHVATMALSLPSGRYRSAAAQIDAYDRLMQSIGAVPAVRSVSLASMLPLEGTGQVNSVVADGTNPPRSERPSANFRFVAPDFFATLGIAIRRGRAFTVGDRADGHPTPVVVSEPLARRLWPDLDPIGRRMGRGIEGEASFEVVGVAADVRYTSIERTPPLMVYLPYWWRSRPSLSLLVKTSLEPGAVIPEIARAIRRIDPEIAIGPMRPLDQLVDAAVAGRRYQARLFVLFGGIALLLATLGVYAVTAYAVSRRRREMNIRVALGASPAGVRAQIVRQSAWPIAAGVIAGVGIAAALGGVLTSLVYEVDPNDPAISMAAAALVGLIGVAAAAVAAKRGLAGDPVAALRVD